MDIELGSRFIRMVSDLRPRIYITYNFSKVLRKIVAKEVFDTELSYVKGLLAIYKLFLLPLKHQAKNGTPIIPTDRIDAIFYQIREIMTLNSQLLISIDERIRKWNRWQKLGDIFVEWVRFNHDGSSTNNKKLVIQARKL